MNGILENLKNDIRKRRRELAELHDRFATDLERGWERHQKLINIFKDNQKPPKKKFV